MRHIVYISGTRADFGLMATTLAQIDADPMLRVSVIVTGMHLDPTYGETWREIEASGLTILGKVSVPMSPATGATMARAIGTMTHAFTDLLEQTTPDCVLLLGDRGEMLAGATAATHLNIPVAHVHGGERSGTIDESIRHAITKLSHLHFAATNEAANRIIALGEQPENVMVTGAPGLDGLTDVPQPDRAALLNAVGLSAANPTALMLFHPVLQEASDAGGQIDAVLTGLIQARWQGIVLTPNADAGSDAIRARIDALKTDQIRSFVHLPRAVFIAHMAGMDAMLGNSSAGIIEAASFGTPVVNIGSRQNMRERNANVRDVGVDADAIAAALDKIAIAGRFPATNVYGDGNAGERITKILRAHPLDSPLLNKVLTF
ncbi:MAG: UDP-N-acetylglucosamine 2-epimerase [Sulfitobacter sp.]